MSVRNNFITGSNPLYMHGNNTWYGEKSQGQVFAYNNGKDDTATFSSGTGAGNSAGVGIFMGDGTDTITFTGGFWQQVGWTTDAKTGISGMEFKNDKGDDILVSGNVKLSGDFTGTANAPVKDASLPPAHQSKENFDGSINRVEAYMQKVYPGLTPDHFVTKDEIQKAIDGGAFDGDKPDPVGKKLMQGVVNAINMGLLKGDLPKSLDGKIEGITSDYLVQAEDKGFNFLV